MRRGLFFLYKLIGVFFVLAALGKTLDSGQIVAVFTFLKIPDVLHSALVMGLILFELTLGVMMIFQLGYRWVLPLSAAVLVFFIFVLGYLFFSPLAPPCGCTGSFAVSEDPRTENLLGICRNFLFLGINIYCWVKTYERTGRKGEAGGGEKKKKKAVG